VSAPIECTVLLSLNLPFTGAFFTLDDPVRGLLDGTYTLSGDLPVDVSQFVQSVAITRGRADELSEFSTGVATIRLFNMDRRFDAEYVAGPYFGNITKGKRVQVLAGTGDVEFTGVVDDWAYEYDVSGLSVAVCTVVDGLANLAGLQFTAWTATAGDTSGVRIGAVLDRPEVSYPVSRNLDAGNSTFQADPIVASTPVLPYIQLIARAELGRFFASVLNLLTFRSRFYVSLHLPATVTITDQGSQAIAGVQRSSPKQMVRNEVTVSRLSGATQISTDTGSVGSYGIIPLQLLNLPLADDTQASGLADFLVGVYGQPQTRFSSIRVIMGLLSDAVRSQISKLDLGSPVSVSCTPNGVGSPVSLPCVVEGVSVDHHPAWHELTLSLSIAQQATVFILDDPTVGVLDGPGLLAF
jgi:hypothetical protein